MRIGIPKETAAGETRVAATPETVKKAIGLGLTVTVQAGAGDSAAITDDAYREAGAEVVDDAAALYGAAEAVLTVQPPDGDALAAMGRGTLLIGMLNPYGGSDHLQAIAAAGVTAVSMELLPRITRAQTMDTLSSQSNVAGYGAVLTAATAFGRLFPMLMTAAGTIIPARVLVLGVGVAGLQAIATARRLGAVVTAYDVRPDTCEQVESLGASFLAVADQADTADQAGAVYAKEMSTDYQAQQAELLMGQMARTDIIITTALIPGKPAPVLVTEPMVQAMKTGSVIVDLAAANGGNCPLSECDQTITAHGVTIIGPRNLATGWATDASNLISRNFLAFITPLVDPESHAIVLDEADEVVSGSLLAKDGSIVHPLFAPEASP